MHCEAYIYGMEAKLTSKTTLKTLKCANELTGWLTKLSFKDNA